MSSKGKDEKQEKGTSGYTESQSASDKREGGGGGVTLPLLTPSSQIPLQSTLPPARQSATKP